MRRMTSSRVGHMRKGSTACEVRCWRWLFGNKLPVSLAVFRGHWAHCPPSRE